MAAAVILALSLVASSSSAEPPVTVAELAGVWAGTLTHAGETEPFALELEPGSDGLVVVMDRASGRPTWHYAAEPAATGAYGFAGSPAVGEGLVFVTGLDGRVHASTQ